MWLILKTAPAKETHVQRAIAALGFETFLPMDIRSKAISRRTRRRVIVETPLIPRVVFLKAPGLQNLPHYALGYARDAVGAVFIEPGPRRGRERRRPGHGRGSRRGGDKRGLLEPRRVCPRHVADAEPDGCETVCRRATDQLR